MAFFMLNIVFNNVGSCFLCDILLVLVTAVPIFCALNGKINCSLNVLFAMPALLYAYFLSDFNQHAAPISTVHYTVFWMIMGLVVLLFFEETATKLITFFVLGLAFIGFHLYKADHLIDSFRHFEPFVIGPFFIYVVFFMATYFLHQKLHGIIQDQTHEIKSTNQSITKTLQDSPFAIAQLKVERDEEGNVLYFTVDRVNHAFESTFKINLYEVQGQKADYIFNLVFKAHFELNKTVLFNKNKTREFHARSLDKWFKIHVLKPKQDRYFVLFEDISKTKKKIAELEENKRRYKVLLEAIPDIFFVIDKDGIYEDFVVKESDLFKVEDAKIIGSSIYNVGYPENLAKQIFKSILKVIKSNSIETIEYSMNTPNGTFLFEMRLAKLNAHSVISISRDITKRKTAEFNLEKALVRAEESDKLKSAFLANLSHEIRTPMNVITNFTRILADTDLSGIERMELTEAISQNGKQLLNMIDNTIHLSKIETKSVIINRKFSKTNALLREVYIRYLVLIPDSKNVRLKLHQNVPNTEFGFETDPAMLTEIIALLVDNAVKYTMQGEINIAYEMIRNEQIKFIVSDTGIGIPEEEFENIFNRFYRIQNEVNERTSGSGLGLPIVQHYIALLGGELRFESKPGEGTKFWFSLPFKNGKGFLSLV